MSVVENLSRDEYQQFDARVFTRWECPIEATHEILSTSTECFACESIAILALLDFQDDTGNILTWEARRVLYEVLREEVLGVDIAP